jgi:ubiquinone/menaquinone biosynthesis C-methylase UbiE
MTKPAQPNFDRVARVYRWAEYLSLGPLLERTREHFLPQLAGRRRALVLGDGDGRFLARLLAQNRELRAIAVDTSAAMLGLLRERCGFAGERLETRQGSALLVTPAQDTDLIVTHFFLDCLTQAEVDVLAARMSAAVQPGALWVVSDFAVPRRPVLGPLAAVYVRALYLAFAVLTGLRVQRLPDPQRALAGAGFERVARQERLGGVIYTEIWKRR